MNFFHFLGLNGLNRPSLEISHLENSAPLLSGAGAVGLGQALVPVVEQATNTEILGRWLLHLARKLTAEAAFRKEGFLRLAPKKRQRS